MPVSYQKNKVHIYKYLENNREKWNEYQNEYRKDHKDMYKRARLRYYYFNKEATRLMNILIDT